MVSLLYQFNLVVPILIDHHGCCQQRIRTILRDMAATDFPTVSFVLIGSEGAVYIMGFKVIGQFPLPDESWWTSCYLPLEKS